MLIYILLYKIGQALNMPPPYYILLTIHIMWQIIKALVELDNKRNKK